MEHAILTKMTVRIKRAFAFAMALLLCLSVVIAAAPCGAAISPLPQSNDAPRHTVCHTISAQAYYTGDYSYAALRSLSGAADASDSAAAMRNNALLHALHDLMARTHTFYTTYSGYQEGSLAYDWKATDSVENSDTYVMFYSDVLSGEGIRLNDASKLPPSAAHSNGDELHPRADSAVFIARQADGGWYFVCNGNYLTSAKTGNRLYWIAEPNDYSIWNLEETGADDLVYIVNLNAAYYGKALALEYYYNGAFTSYSQAAAARHIAYWTGSRSGKQFFDEAGTQAVEDPEAPVLPALAPEAGCPVCGKTHNGGVFDRLIGWFHALIHWIRSFFEIVC